MNRSTIIIIKVGTGVLTMDDNSLNLENIKAISQTIHSLKEQGHDCLLVSSGSVAAGAHTLRLAEYPQSLVMKQVCASIGQPKLMKFYRNELLNYDLEPAQVLMTHHDLHHVDSRDNLDNLLNSLLDNPKLVPIINQNDSVATEELNLGDNDHLAVALAAKLRAKKLFILSTVEGLCDTSTGDVLSEITSMDQAYKLVDPEDKGHFSMGGMYSKLRAIENAQQSGIECYILNGHHATRILEHEKDSFIGTKFSVNKSLKL